MSGCVAQLVLLRHVVTLQRGRKTSVFFNENSVSSYVTVTNTLRTSVVLGALLRASQRESAACHADNFVISFTQSANAVILSARLCSAVRDIRRKSVSCGAMGERPRGGVQVVPGS